MAKFPEVSSYKMCQFQKNLLRPENVSKHHGVPWDERATKYEHDPVNGVSRLIHPVKDDESNKMKNISGSTSSSEAQNKSNSSIEDSDEDQDITVDDDEEEDDVDEDEEEEDEEEGGGGGEEEDVGEEEDQEDEEDRDPKEAPKPEQVGGKEEEREESDLAGKKESGVHGDKMAAGEELVGEEGKAAQPHRA